MAANPLLDPSAFMSLEDVRTAIGKPGKPAHHYKVKAFLAEHGIAPLELGARAIMYEREAVERALAGKPAEAPTLDPRFDPNEFLSLAAVRRLLGAGRVKPYDNRRALVWLARASVPVFRPTPRMALIPKAELARAMDEHTTVQRPMRRNPHQRLPPYVRSRAQEASQERATRAASAARAGLAPRERTPRLEGAAMVQHKRQLAAWGRDARKAERAGRTIPPVPEIDRSPKPAPVREPASGQYREPRPLNTQPNSRLRTKL